MEMHTFARMKRLGIAVTAASAVAFVALLAVSLQIAEAGHSLCPGAAAGCTILGHFPLESFAGLAALAGLMFTGAWLSIKAQSGFSATLAASTAVSGAAKRLEGGERMLYDFVIRSDGTAFQSDLVKNSGYSKVKVSRILDRLEAKGLVERRRRGMANLVVARR